MADLLNLFMLVCAAVGSMAFGVLLAYGIFRVGFGMMRPQSRRPASRGKALAGDREHFNSSPRTGTSIADPTLWSFDYRAWRDSWSREFMKARCPPCGRISGSSTAGRSASPWNPCKAAGWA